MKNLGKVFLLLAFACLTTAQSSPLQLIFVIDKCEASTDGNEYVTLWDTPITVDLLSGTVLNSTQKVADLNLPSGTYTSMKLYISHVDFVEGGGTQHYETTLVNYGLSIYPMVATSNHGDNVHSIPMMPFAIDAGSSPSLHINIFCPPSAIAGSSIGNYSLSAPPTIACEGNQGGAGGSVSGLISGTTAGKDLYVGLFTTSNPNSPPQIGMKVTSQAGATAYQFPALPYGTHYVMAFEDQSPSGLIEPDLTDSNGDGFSEDKMGIYGVLPPSDKVPDKVVLSASAPNALGINFSVTPIALASAGQVFGCKVGDPNANATFSGSAQSNWTSGLDMNTATVFLGCFRLTSSEVSSLNLSSATSVMGTIHGVFTNHPEDFFTTFVPVSGSPFHKDFQIDGLPSGTYLLVGFLDVDGDGNPENGELWSWSTTLYPVNNNEWKGGAVLLFNSASPYSISF